MKGLLFLSFADETTSEESMLAPARRALRTLAFSPLVRPRLMARYDREFATAETAHLFRGVYDSFDEAVRAAPDTKPVGYDNPGPASMYRNLLERVYLSDYPVLFWLSRFLPGAKRLFDLGGHVGVRYYAFRSRLGLAADLVWQVMDVKAVTEAGRELAREKGATALHFTERREDLAGADVLFSTGALQYLEKPLHEILRDVSPRPPYVVINQMPMQNGPAYYTLQSIGTAFCPYRIEDREGLIAGMAALGYEKLDEWNSPDKRVPIPFRPDRSIRGYTGMCFRARERA